MTQNVTAIKLEDQFSIGFILELFNARKNPSNHDIGRRIDSGCRWVSAKTTEAKDFARPFLERLQAHVSRAISGISLEIKHFSQIPLFSVQFLSIYSVCMLRKASSDEDFKSTFSLLQTRVEMDEVNERTQFESLKAINASISKCGLTDFP